MTLHFPNFSWCTWHKGSLYPPPRKQLAFYFGLRAESSQNVGLEMPALQIRIRYDGSRLSTMTDHEANHKGLIFRQYLVIHNELLQLTGTWKMSRIVPACPTVTGPQNLCLF